MSCSVQNKLTLRSFRKGYSQMPAGKMWLSGVIVISLFVLVALLAPWLVPYDPHEISGASLEPPGHEHFLGTNDLGQDILSELLIGTRRSLFIGFVAGLGCTLLGLFIGVAAGYCSGWPGKIFNRIIYLFMIIPSLPVMLLVAALLGPGLWNIIVVMVLFGWPVEARVIRSQTFVIKSRVHIEAAALLGAGTIYIWCRHVLVELLPLVLVATVMQVSRALLTEAGLAFLGLGDPTAKSWGMIIRYALDYKAIYFTDAWLWWLLPPGLCIAAAVMALNLIGYGLEELADRRLGERKHGTA